MVSSGIAPGFSVLLSHEELLLPLKRPIKAAVKDQQAGLGALGCGPGKGEGGVG